MLIERLILQPKLFSIYNYDNFEISKLIIKNSKIELETPELIYFVKKILNQNKNFSLQNMSLVLSENKKLLANFNRVSFSNYGYNKNLFKGKIFDKKFNSTLKKVSALFLLNFPILIFKLI